MDVSVIIVNYNTANIISACINSVLRQKNINCEIIVVDNASGDNSLAVLQQYHDQLKIIANNENIGFGRANNLGFQQSQGRYIFLLNPDACLQSEYDLAELMQFMDDHPDYGLAGPKVIKNQRTTPPSFTYPGQKNLKGFVFNLPGKIAWVIGACMIIRREVYENAKGFDEDYFLYGEEADLCLRVRKLGYAIGYYDKIVVTHIGGASEVRTQIAELWQKKQNGIQLFYKKNYDSTTAKTVVQKDLQIAQRKLILLKLKKMFFGLNSKEQEKLIRNQIISETSKIFLK